MNLKTSSRQLVIALIACPWLVTCARDASAPQAADVAVAAALSSPAASAAFGFESLAGWTVSSGTRSLGTPRTQGQTALLLQSPVNYTTLTSAPLALTAADLAPLTQEGSYVAIDMSLPVQQPNPYWFGAAQMFLSCPDRGVYNAYLGQHELTGKRLGSYLTYRFAIPGLVRQQLAQAACSNFSVTFVVNVPSAGTGLYRIDNIRFKTSADPGSTGTGASVNLIARRSYAPPASTPGAATFAESRIQVPESFHVATGNAGTGQLTLLLSLGAGDQTTCTYAGASQGSRYFFSSCSRGERAGDLVLASAATMTIVSGNASAGETKVKAQLAVDPTGDELASGLTPIPTFWGDTSVEMSAIGAAYMNRVAAAPRDGLHVTLALPARNKKVRQVRVRDMLDPNAPPLSPTDPPFDQYGDLDGDDLANGYWRLSGNADGFPEGPDRFHTHFQGTLGVHGVILGHDIEVVKGELSFDSDSGVVGISGRTGGSSSGQARAYVFGTEVGSAVLGPEVTDVVLASEDVGHDIPVFSFGILTFSVGLHAGAHVTLHSQVGVDGGSFTLTPDVTITASVSGKADVLIASGGLSASVELLNLALPITASLLWGINTNPGACNAELRFVTDADATVSLGAGKLVAHVTFGNCDILDLCHTETWNITDWDAIIEHTEPFLHMSETPANIALPRSLCDRPFAISVDCVGDGETLIVDMPIGFGSTANVPPGQAPPGSVLVPSAIPCEQRTWSTTGPDDVIVQGGCDAIIHFHNTGNIAVTMQATNGFTTETATKLVNVVGAGTGTFARIVTPPQGCVRDFPGATPTQLRGAAVAPGGQPLTLSWSVQTGDDPFTPLGQGEIITWTTPSTSTEGVLRLFAVRADGESVTVTNPFTVDKLE